jgi:periplasmic divalent cation tolerance protein
MNVLITTCRTSEAAPLLKKMLAHRLVACGNIFKGIRSLYWWKGNICDEEESFIFMETSNEKVQEAKRSLEELHPYEVPKILILKPENVNTAYLSWLQTEVQT